MRISKISHVQSITPINEKGMLITKALQEIKEGVYSNQVAIVRANIHDDIQRGIEKKKLPLFLFGGTFTSRSKKDLIKSSGFAILDFDHVDDLLKVRKEIEADKFTYSVFLSPSGDGLKLLVNIPPVGNDKDYKSFYSEIMKHYSQYAEPDKATTDICRTCYVSHDPNLYVNTDSSMFTDRTIENEISLDNQITENIVIEDLDEIASRVLKWFKKNYTTTSNRNNNLFILCSAFNSFGVSKEIAKSVCMPVVAKDFTETEIDSLIRSAYKNTSEFGTKNFTDTKKKQSLNRLISSGASKEEIISKFGNTESVNKEIKEVSESLISNVFWYLTKDGKIEISYVRFDQYLKNKGIAKYFPFGQTGSDYEFITKDKDFVDWIDTTRIKDIVKSDLMKRGEIDVWNVLAQRTSFFKRDSLNMLDTVQIELKRDTKDESFIYYKNGVVRTTSEGSNIIDYKDIDEVVWQNQVIEREMIISKESEGEFKRFLWLISGENADRYYTLKSVVGFLLHSHQNQSKPKAIIFNDEMMSDVANGGSGKGLIHKAIGHIKNMVIEDGKKFDHKSQFAYQKVNKDTQVLLMDDVPKNFNFESLFSVITEGITIEKKGKDAYQIPFSENPKISLTTNYTVRGEGASHRRRIFEVEIANYFNDTRTPEDVFGHQFFSEWSKDEWHKFDNYMNRCIQYFLKEGLVESDKVNLNERKFKNNLGAEFIEFMDDKTFANPVCKKELRKQFTNENPELTKYNSAKAFNRKVAEYCDYHNFKLDSDLRNGTKRMFKITKILNVVSSNEIDESLQTPVE